MAVSLRNGKSYVSHLRVRGVGLDPLVTQLRMENLLHSTSLQPSGLAPSAIICVRRLRARLPAFLRQRHDNVPPTDAWEKSVSAKLDQLVRRAARPAHGAVPTDAEAVIFEDRAQMLACMASDWCAGNFHARWWWQSLFKEAATARIFLHAWLDAPEYVPAALAHLSQGRKIGPFIRSLNAPDALALLHGIRHSFALEELGPALEALSNREVEAGRERVAAAVAGDAPPASQQSAVAAQTARLSPWREYLAGNEIAGICLEAQCLLGISLMLARVPAAVRAPSFARDLQRWIKAATSVPPDVAAGSHGPAASHQPVRGGTAARVTSTATRQAQSRRPDAKPEPVREDEAGQPGTAPTGHEERRREPFLDQPQPAASASQFEVNSALQMSTGAASVREEMRGELSVEGSAGDEWSVATQPASMSDGESRRARDDERQAVEEQSRPVYEEVGGPTLTRAGSVPFDETSDARVLLEPLLEARLETGMGGIFYLINVGLFLNLYGDFTTPAEAGIPLSIWDFLALLGQELGGEKMRADTLWPVLARLAGRTLEAAPGQDFVPPGEWRLPPAWLVAFPERSVCTWTTDGARLRLRHAEEFRILDLPLNASDPEGQLELEMKAYALQAPFELRRGSSDGEAEVACGALECWSEWLAAYVRARLGRALGLERAQAVSKLLFECRARVFITASHLDVVFELAQLPIEVRLAGLDRNPGWVPAAGRFIAFHYD
jgi:hypothetical protein